MPSATTSATASLTAQPPIFRSAALSASASMAGLQYSTFSPPEVYTPRFVTTLTADITSGLRPTVISVAATQAVFGNGTFSIAVYDAGTDANPVNFEAFEVIGGATSLNWTVVTESGWSPTTHSTGSTVVATVLTPRSISQPLTNHTSVLATPDPHSIYLRKNSFNNKGDLLIGTGGTGQFLALPAAADGQTLLTDSTRPTGVRWAPSSITSVLQHMGDLLVGGVLGLSQRLGIGTTGQVLTVGTNTPAVADPTISPTVSATGSGGSLVNGTAYNFAYAWQTPNTPPDGGITLPSPITSFVATATGSVQIQAPACPVSGGSLIVYGAALGGTLAVQAVLTPASSSSANLVVVSAIGGGAAPSTANTTGGIGPNWHTLAAIDLPQSPSFNGEVTATDFRASAMPGTTRQARFVGGTSFNPPGNNSAGGWQVGDVAADATGTLWVCITAGPTGTWTKSIPFNLYPSQIPLVNGSFIQTQTNYTTQRVTMTSNITGVNFQFGQFAAQQYTLINESAFTMTFDVSTSSLVANGTACAIGPLTRKTFVWDSAVGLWFESGTALPMSPSGANHAGGLVPDPGSTSGATHYLREDATWAIPSGSAGGVASAALSASTRLTAVAQIPVFGASGASHSVGLVPDPGSSAGTTRFLAENQAWAVPAGTGGGSSGGGISGSGGLVPIQTQTLSATASTISFTVPTGFKNLRVTAQVRSDASGNFAANGLRMQFNGDSGTNYASQRGFFDGTSVSAGQGTGATSAEISGLSATGTLANSATVIDTLIPNASGSTFFKTWTSRAMGTANGSTITGMQEELYGGVWQSTSAITSIALIPGTGNFIAGSTATLWGESDTAPTLLTSNSNLIQETVLTAAQSTITVSNIPQGYKDLRVVIDTRGDAALGQVGISIQFNGDTGSNYDAEALEAFGSSTAGVQRSSAATAAQMDFIAGASAPATQSGMIYLDLPNYTNTSFRKQGFWRSGWKTVDSTNGQVVGIGIITWRSAAAITSFVLSPASGNFISGSVVRVYGEPAASAGPSVGSGTRARISTNQSIASGSAQVVTWDTEDVDADNQHYTSSANLTGTLAKTSGSAAIVGTSTLFTTELSVGQVISVPGTATEVAVVIAITDATHLTVATPFANTASGQTAARVNSAFVFRQPGMWSIELGAYMAAVASGVLTTQIRLNGSTIIGQADKAGVNASAGYDLVVQRQFQQWDYVEVLLTQGTGSAVNLTADERTHISIQSRPTVIVAIPYVNIQDQKAQNTTGGSTASYTSAFTARVLNTVVTDTAAISSLASNQITLLPGTYRVHILVPGFGCDVFQSRLQNITDSTTTLLGTSARAANADNTMNSSEITGKFTVTASKVFEVQMRAQTSYVNGLGSAANFATEVYTVVEIWKEG